MGFCPPEKGELIAFFRINFAARSSMAKKSLYYVLLLSWILASVASAARPVLWLKFDEGSGTSVADSSGNGYNGVLRNDAGVGTVAQRWVEGCPSAVDNSGGAYQFKSFVDPNLGYTVWPQCVVPGAVCSTMSDQISMAFWERTQPADFPGSSGGVAVFSGTTYATVWLNYPNGFLWFWTGTSASNEYWYSPGGQTVWADGSWTHFVFTKNCNTGLEKIYRNGSLFATSAGRTKPFNGSSTMTMSYVGFGNGNLQGDLDDFRMFDEEAPADAIAHIAGLGDAKKAYWPKPAIYTESILTTGITLIWNQGDNAAINNGNDIYLGTSFGEVKNAATTSAVYKGRQTANSYDTGTLIPNQIYFWRVDQIADDGSVTAGDVWAFITISDFNVTIQNDTLKYVIGGDCTNKEFSDMISNINYIDPNMIRKFAKVRVNGILYNATRITAYSSSQMTVKFDEPNITMILDIAIAANYFTLEVNSVAGDNVEELIFINIGLKNKGDSTDIFPGCALVMNYNTRINTTQKNGLTDWQLPGSNKQFAAASYRKTGIVGAKAAIIGTPKSDFRNAMKNVVDSITDINQLATSSCGGPYAMDDANNYESYVICNAGLGTSQVSNWANMCNSLSIKQINMCGFTSITKYGGHWRWGDYTLNPFTYPNGKSDLISVINTLHSAGIKAGLHNFSFFISPESSYVTPIPDHNLASDAIFTLTSAINSSGTIIPVDESTSNMYTYLGGLSGVSSLTLRIDDELITYSGLKQTSPYNFNTCTRGAFGTTAASHNANTKVYHLREYYGCFLPDPNSNLFMAIAQNIADLYNDCGFDMMYFDALDGECALANGSWEWGHYYGAKFCQEVFKRINKDPIWESAMFDQYLWFIRSRAGASDIANRGYKTLIDNHTSANTVYENMLLPTNLGWWKINFGLNNQIEPSFSDITQYLCTKAIGFNSSLSFEYMTPEDYNNNDYKQKTVQIIKKYENLRLTDYFSAPVKQRFQAAGEEFILDANGTSNWDVHQAEYDLHKVEAIDDIRNVWRVHNRFAPQPLKLRIHALETASAYSGAANITLTDVNTAPNTDFPLSNRATAANVSINLSTSTIYHQVGTKSLCYSATNNNSSPVGAWTVIQKTLPTTDLHTKQTLGFWLYGDGKGEVMNFQLTNPFAAVTGKGEHYIIIDFVGWRYFELIEPDSSLYSNYIWPYSGGYGLFFYNVDYNNVPTMNIWYNNIPANSTVTCYLSSIKAISTNTTSLTSCSATVDGNTITFPCTIPSGSWLEFNSIGDCKLYQANGTLNSNVTPIGIVPNLKAGENTITFNCGISILENPRVNVTVITKDPAIMTPEKSTRPAPASGSTRVDPTANNLTWLPGAGVKQHHVYFGTDLNAVNNALSYTPADLNYDNWVDTKDLVIFAGAWLSSSCGSSNKFCGGADINHDGTVSLSDFASIANSWMMYSGSPVYKGSLPDTTNNFNAGPLAMGTTYYWRIDEVNNSNSVIKGDMWSFTVIPYKANTPNPHNNTIVTTLTKNLNWMSGYKASSHSVYFGTVYNDINIATTSSAVYKGNQQTTTYVPGILAPSIYYWRIDEIDSAGVVTKGDVWTFQNPSVVNANCYADFYAINQGNYNSGSVSDLRTDDTSYLVVVSATGGGAATYATTDFTISDITINSPSKIDLTVVTKSSISATTQGIFLWNFSTSAWDLKDNTTIGTSEVTRNISITSGCSNYINSGQLKVRVKGSHGSYASFNFSHDQVQVKITP